jgi:hypothetical protein
MTPKIGFEMTSKTSAAIFFRGNSVEVLTFDAKRLLTPVAWENFAVRAEIA